MSRELAANYDVAPTKIHIEDKGEYLKALDESQEKKSNIPFREFMAKQHLKTLKTEINNYKKDLDRNANFHLLF